MSDASSAPDLSRLSIPKTPLRRRSGGGWGRFLPWLVVIVLAAVGWFFFGDRIQALRAPKSEEPDGPPTVRIQAAGVLRAATEGLSANGYVVARRRAALSTVLSGRLVEIRVEEGSRVEKDDIIARIQFDDYEAQLAEAKAALEVTKAQRAQAETEVTAAARELEESRSRLEFWRTSLSAADADAGEAERERDRQRKNFEDGVIPLSEWDRFQTLARRLRAAADAAAAQLGTGEHSVATMAARRDARQAALAPLERDLARGQEVVRQAEILIEKTWVRAPFSGVITDKGAEQGEVVAATGAGGNSRGSVATLVDLETLEVQVELPESRLESLREGSRALIFLNVNPNRAHPGRIRQVWPRADRQKGTVELRITFDKRPEVLREEMGLRVNFPTDPALMGEGKDEAVLSIPERALVEADSGHAVWALKSGRMRRVDVEVERRENGRAFLGAKGGLRPGDEVLAEPWPGIEDGSEYLGLGAK